MAFVAVVVRDTVVTAVENNSVENRKIIENLLAKEV
jgi:hypothetical protein